MTETHRRSESALQQLREIAERENQTDSGLRRLAQALTGQLDDRLTCAACEEALPAYVDDEISGVDVARKHADVKHHLDLCEACASTYAHLLQLTWEMEQHVAALPALESALDLSFLPRLTFQEKMREYISALADELTAMLAPQDMDILEAARDTVLARLETLGNTFRLQEAAPAVLGFGSETPEGLRILATTYMVTLELAGTSLVRVLHEGMPDARRATELCERGVLYEYMPDAQRAKELRQRVEKIARGTGVGRQQARKLAQQYVELVTSRPEMLIDLAVEEE